MTTAPALQIGLIVSAKHDAGGVLTHVGIQGVYPYRPVALFTKAEALEILDFPETELHTLFWVGEHPTVGAKVHTVRGKWLQTDPNDTEADNLGNVDEYPGRIV